LTKETRYRHWKNPSQPGTTTFVTATCLDFAHLFQREELRTEMMLSPLDDCLYYRARLHAFVIMTHHFHALVTPGEETTISSLIQRLKRNASKKLSPLLNENETRQLNSQAGLNRSNFWKPSFRGFAINSEETFLQKAKYIHLNPLRAELTDDPDSYQWSSAHYYQLEMQSGLWELDCVRILDYLRKI
jgi:REP element-mobilizing transposase RayT